MRKNFQVLDITQQLSIEQIQQRQDKLQKLYVVPTQKNTPSTVHLRDGALRKQLLEECNLYAVLELPGGAFTGTGVKTVVLFFEKGNSTKKVWYYQLNLGRNLGKTNSLNEKDLEEFVTLSATQADSENSWSISVSDINKSTWDLTASNPNLKDTTDNGLSNRRH